MRTLEYKKSNLMLKSANALIVVPPFAGIDRPSISAHLLQACSRENGLSIEILYSNVLLAKTIGELTYQSICYAPTPSLIGERLFSKAAYSLPPLGHLPSSLRIDFESSDNLSLPKLSLGTLKSIVEIIPDWLDGLVAEIVKLGYPVVGCTNGFEQTSASIAILKRIKKISPRTITIMGGPNCEEEMADGILSLTDAIDYVFSGESEVTFTQFLTTILKGNKPCNKVIKGTPFKNLNNLPIPEYDDYYTQLRTFLPEGKLIQASMFWLPVETSRGCWWGQKHQCYFCGINGKTLRFREKDPDRVLMELNRITQKKWTKNILMIDSIMPFSYFKTLLPRLAKEFYDYHFFYEQKANLSFEQIKLLKEAGINVIQPGIEALSTSLLKRMSKGITASQNLFSLKWSRAMDIQINWNLLHTFPGDKEEDYVETLELLPLIRHFSPPSGANHLSIDRFSPYFEKHGNFNIQNIRPMNSYSQVFPSTADLNKLAYHFVADYESATRRNPKLTKRLEKEVKKWRKAWDSDSPPPMFGVTPIAENCFLMIDSRFDVNQPYMEFIDGEKYRLAAKGGKKEEFTPSVLKWGKKRKVFANVDGKLFGLAVETNTE
ncbi:MAG: RiPP maturation radical SAM C-methyltransferase [Candidatus Omnitrophota bacterium]